MKAINLNGKPQAIVKLGFVFMLTFACAPMLSVAHSHPQQCQQSLQIKETQEKPITDELLLSNYQERNRILAQRYPKLAFFLSDPEHFFVDMTERFEKQKKLTPEDPRLFNFPEAAPTMLEIREDLAGFRSEVQDHLSQLSSKSNHKIMNPIIFKKTDTLNKVIQYVDNLNADISKMVSENRYPYIETVYTLYFYARIRGFFQFKELNSYHQIAKYLDMHMHGYRRLNIDEELALYKAKGSPILQVRSGKLAKEFRIAELPFRHAFDQKETLEFVIIPSVAALGKSAFIHLLPHRIHVLGATNNPIEADGFNRPGGLFWMHDVRHEADRYMKMTAYKRAQSLTKNQTQKLVLLQQKWHAEFLQFKNSIQDSNLRESLDHYYFYTHHDVGIPLTPSMFLHHHRDGLHVYYSFLFHKKKANQDMKFDNWFSVTPATQRLLESFWRERLPQENGLLGRDPVKINQWEDWFPESYPNNPSVTSSISRALRSPTRVRVAVDSNFVEGKLHKAIFNSEGKPTFLEFRGPTQIVDRSLMVLPQQGFQTHSSGYSTPVGKIESITVNNSTVALNDLHIGQTAKIIYESGIVVTGTIERIFKGPSGQDLPQIITFSSMSITMNKLTLYKPEWGSFDLILGNEIGSVQFLNPEETH